jgi:hypothetical protein
MNDYDYSDYSATVREAIENNKRREREVLAKKLTGLRANAVKGSRYAGYLDALDAVAAACGIHTEVVVRYFA